MKPSLAKAAAVAALGVGLFGAPAAMAQGDRAAAEALFQAGRDLMDAGRYEEACKKFEASLRSDSALGTVLNLANCYEKVGRLASAWERFEEATQKLGPNDDRLPIAKVRAAALAPRLPRIELTLDAQAPAGTRVLRDEVAVDPGALGMAIPVDPGSHRIVVQAPGRIDVELSIEVREGELVKRLLSAGDPLPPPRFVPPPPPPVAPRPEPGPSAALPPLPRAEPPSWWSRQRVAGVAMGSVGVVGMAVSLGEGAVAMGKKSIVSQSCNSTTRICANQAGIDAAAAGRTAATVSTAAFVVSAVAIAGGVTLVATGSPDRQGATGVHVGGAVLPGAGWVTVGRAFRGP